MILIDSHCHLNSEEFKNNYSEIIADCLKQGIGLVNIGADYKSSKLAVEIANEYVDKPIYSSIGMHPESLNEKFDEQKFAELINNKVMALGEIGLEYFFENNLELKEKQKQLFMEQLNFAQKNNLPIILHARGSKNNPDDAYEDVLEIVSSVQYQSVKEKKITGVVHCFSASREISQKFLDLGFYIGLTGLITFKNKTVDSLRETVKIIPLEKILVETDAPYMTPEPHRGEQNMPQYVEFVARKLAEIKDISYQEVCKITTENFKRLFLNELF